MLLEASCGGYSADELERCMLSCWKFGASDPHWPGWSLIGNLSANFVATNWLQPGKALRSKKVEADELVNTISDFWGRHNVRPEPEVESDLESESQPGLLFFSGQNQSRWEREVGILSPFCLDGLGYKYKINAFRF